MSQPTALTQPDDPAALVGTTLDGRYEIVEHLASGGMGAVFRARHLHMGTELALKVLRRDLSASRELVDRFRQEARIAFKVHHENLVRVTDSGQSQEGWIFLAMELLSGENLFERLRREIALSPEEAALVLWQVCSALEAAHAHGVVHRDLKPENVFLARLPDGREVVKVLDFGIAKIVDPTSDTATTAGTVVGTPEYLSPEQATGSAVDGRADLYTVGLIGWRMLAGRHPFRADNPRALLMMQATQPVPPLAEANPELASWPALCAVVARACEKEPSARYQTATEMKAGLAAAMGPAFAFPVAAPSLSSPSLSSPGLPGGPSPSGAETRRFGDGPVTTVTTGPAARVPARAPARRRALLWGAVAGALALAATLGASSLFASRRPPPPDDTLARAGALLEAGRPGEARALLEPRFAELKGQHAYLDLLGHARRADGAPAEALDAWRQAQALGPLDTSALDLLADDLGRDKAIADEAAQLLGRAGAAAGPALARTLATAAAPVRLKALKVARAIGPPAHIDVAAQYLDLLGDADCAIRKEAARALGEMGERRALPRLREEAVKRDEKRGLFGVITASAPACGAPEAAEAARRIERR